MLKTRTHRHFSSNIYPKIISLSLSLFRHSQNPKAAPKWIRTRPLAGPAKSLYSTVVIHDDDEEDGVQQDRLSRPIAIALGADEDGGNDFGTMIVKTDRSRPRSRSTSTSPSSSGRRGPAPPPPPPRANLPCGSPFADARRRNPIKWAVDEEEKEEEEDGEGFSTFVVRLGERESVSGTVVRRTGGGDVGSTMSFAF